MLYQEHARDRKAWITLVYAGHPNPEVDPDGPPLHASSRLCKTRDAQPKGLAAASSDWVVAETQPLHTNSSTDLALKLRHDSPIPPQPPSPHPKPYNFPGIKQCAARSSGE